MKKSIAIILKVLIIATMLVNEAFAQQCSENTNVNGIAGTGFSNGSLGQSFTACQTGKLANVAIQSGNASVGFNNVVCQIFAGDGTGGSSLAVTGQVHVGANRTVTFDLSSYNIKVTEGQKYTAYFYTYSGSPMIAYGTYANAAVDYYPRGRIYGAAQAHNDMYFSARIDVLNNTVTPVHQATEVSRLTDLKVQFSRGMTALTGDVELVDVVAATSDIFPVGDLVIDGGLVSIPNTSTLNANTQYEIIIPSGALKSTDGLDFAGFGTGAWTFTTTPDRVATVSSTEGEFTNTSPIPFAIDFSEAVTGFDDTDLTITNGTASNFAGSGTSYTVDITPNAEGIVKVETLADVTDEGNEVAGDSLIYDITSPTVTITSDASGTITRSPIEIIVQFSEPVTGFDAEFLTRVNVEEVFTYETINDSTFSLFIDASNEGTMTVTVPALSATDLAGNTSLASAEFSVDYELDLNDGLISHFPLNGVRFDINNLNEDLVEFNGTPASSEDHHGQVEGGYNFSTSILYGQSFDNAPLENGFSISTWIRPTSEMGAISAKRVIYEHATTSTLYYESNALRLDINGTTDQYVHPIVLPANTWVHLAVSVTQDGKVYLYIDNIQYDLGTGPSSLIETSNFLSLGSTSAGNSLLNGDMDDFRYYGRAIHSVEAFELYNEAEYLLETETLEICANDSFTTPAGAELTEDGKYGYVDPSGDATPDTFVILTLTTISVPDVTATADNLIVCEGNEVVLTGQGADTYVWDNGVIDGEPFIPTATTIYTVTGTAANGCQNTNEVTVQVAPRDFDDEVLSTTAPEFCPDGSEFSATISTASSAVGVNYYLRNSSDDAIVDGPIAGTGSALNFNAGTLTGTTTFNVFAEQPSTSTNYALDFDGTDDRVATTYTLPASSTLTFEGWLYPRSTNYDRILTNYAGSGTAVAGDILIDTYDASANNGKALRLYATGSGNLVNTYSVPNVLTLNAWNHWAITFDNGVVKIFVDGVEVGSSTMAFTTIPAATAPFHLGEDSAGPGGENLNGKMDEIRIWNVAKTAGDLLASKDILLEGTETDLSAYFNFDDGSGTTVTELVSGADGTLTNMDGATDWVTGADISSLDYFSCSFEMTQKITIGDQTAPVVIAQDVEVQLDETGFIVLDAAIFNNGSSDNCTMSEDLILELDQTLFSCDDVGVHTVTLTVTDAAGNQSSTTASVTILSPLNDQAVTIADETLCSSDLQGTIVTIDGSQIGIDYYLRNSADDSILDGPITGTGGALDFATGQLSESATFNVYAETTPLGDNALDFDGSDDYLSASVNPSFDYGNGYTLEAWVNSPLTTGSKHYPIFHLGNSSYSDIEVYLQNGSNRLIVLNNRRSGVAANYKEYPTPPVNTWYHLSVTYDGTNLNAYYNGVLQTPLAANNGSTLTKTGDAQLTIGYIINSTAWANAQRNFTGKLDEIRMWDSSKTGSDIQALMNTCIAGDESGLMTYYNFDKGNGISVPDLAGDQDATLVNMDSETDYVAGPEGLTCTRYQCSVELSTEVSITVEQDDIAPVAIAQDITIELDATGAATITVEDVNNGSTDNCTALEDLLITIDQTQFDETMIGENTVILSVEDGSGNIATATAVVTVTSEIEDRAVTTASSTICPDADAIITLSNSQERINYTLRNENNVTIAGPLPGSGLDLDFNIGTITGEQTFNVFAETLQIDDEAFNQGAIGYVTVPSSSSLRLDSDWTIEAWVLPAGVGLHIVETYDANGGFALRTTNSGTVQVFAMFSASTSSSVIGSTALQIGEWSHIAATFNETTNELKVYVNGVLDNTNANATVDQRGSLIPIKLGARGDDNRTSSSHVQDEIRIWNVERTIQEINDNKSMTLAGNEAGLVAYFDYNNITVNGVTTIVDKSGNGNNGATVGNYTQGHIITGALPSQPDKYGIQMSNTLTITPVDATPPTVLTQDLSLILDANGDASITVEDIDNGSSDNCTGIENLVLSLDKTTFDINDLGANTVTLTVSDANGNSNSATATVNISDKQEQTISFDAIDDKTFGDADFSIAASTDSSLPIVFSVVSGNVTITNNETVSINGAGSATIRASQAGDDTYAPALLERTFNIEKADQVLTINSIPQKTIASPDFEVVASVDTEFALDYAVSGPASNTGSMVTLDGTIGTVTVTVSHVGTDNYNEVSESINFEVVDQTSQVVSFTGVADKTFGNADFDIVATVDSSLPLSFSVVSGNVSIVEADGSSATISIVGAGAAVIRASNDGDEIYAPYQEDLAVDVAKADQVITIEEVSTKTLTAQPITISAGIDTGLALDYAVSGPATNSGNVVTLDGTVGIVTVTVSQAGTDNYNVASNSISFEVVAKQEQTITFTDIPDLTYGVADQALSASSTSELTVSFNYISGPATLTGSSLAITGSGTIVVEAIQAGDDDFLPASVQQTIEVTKAELVITADNQTINYGDALPALTYQISGLVNGESESNIASEISISTTADDNEGSPNAGTYPIAIAISFSDGQENYSFTTQDATLTINKLDQVIAITAIDDKEPTDLAFDAVATVDSDLELSYEVSGPAAISGSTITLDGTEGTVTVTVSQTGDINHNAATASITFEVAVILGLGDGLSEAISIYPNPVTEYVMIETDQLVDVRFYGLNGQLIKEISQVNGKLDVSNMKSGTYLMEVSNAEEKITVRIHKAN